MDKQYSTFDQLLIDVFKYTCNIVSNITSFDEFWEKYKEDIFTELDIDNPSEEEFNLVKKIFTDHNDILGLKNIVDQLSKNTDWTYDKLENLTFECVVAVVHNTIDEYRWNPPREKTSYDHTNVWIFGGLTIFNVFIYCLFSH